MNSNSAGSVQGFTVCKANFNVSELRGSSGKAKRAVSHFPDDETGAREGKALAKCVHEHARLCVCVLVSVCMCKKGRERSHGPVSQLWDGARQL